MDRREMMKGAAALAAAAPLPGWTELQTEHGTGRPARKNRVHQSVSRWCYKQTALEDLCAYAASIGLDGVDLLHPEEYDVPARHGLVCTMGYAGGGEIDHGLNRVEHHDEIVAGMQKYIPLAAKARVPNVITFSGLRDGISDDEGARNTILGLKRLARVAEDHNVVVCMELLNSKVDHHGYMCDHTAWGARVCEEVGSEHVKLLYDIYHMQIMEGDLIRTITDHHRWIAHYHTGGVPGRHELDDTQEVLWPAVMRGILATGFTGYVAHEFVPVDDPLTSLEKAVTLCDV